MESNDELKEIDIKIVRVIISRTQLKLKILILIIFYWMKKHMKIFWFLTFHTKL